MEDLNTTGRMHKIIMTNRRTCTVNGVNDVLSFDLREILLETEQGMLMIRGNELHVNRLTLDKGEVDIDGRIDSFVYSDTAASGEKQGFRILEINANIYLPSFAVDTFHSALS